MNELEVLLENYWIVKAQDRDLYYRIKDSADKYKNFIQEKLGYRLIINPYLIKLEKIPGKPEPWMGIQAFEDRMEYVFLCLLLTFLEDKGAGEQFVLSEATDFIETAFEMEPKVDWTLYTHRRYMVKVMRFASGIGLIKANDGDEGRFIETVETDVLYESTGISRYFARIFSGDIMDYSSWEDINSGEWLDVERDKGKVRRHRVYRRLVMSPSVYSEGPDDADYIYIRNYRKMVQKDLDEILGFDLQVHKNGVFAVADSSKNYKDVFPSNKSISDI